MFLKADKDQFYFLETHNDIRNLSIQDLDLQSMQRLNVTLRYVVHVDCEITTQNEYIYKSLLAIWIIILIFKVVENKARIRFRLFSCAMYGAMLFRMLYMFC